LVIIDVFCYKCKGGQLELTCCCI